MGLWVKSDWINPVRASSYNWIDFTFVQLAGEWDNRFGAIEFHAALLGFHVGGSWNIGKGDEALQSRLNKMMEEIDSGELRVSLSLKEYNELKERA